MPTKNRPLQVRTKIFMPSDKINRKAILICPTANQNKSDNFVVEDLRNEEKNSVKSLSLMLNASKHLTVPSME